ncbi:hypothetical protein O5343_27420, partial [Escherichia coli]|nr:hypothetical protein [Escherichia coli]
AGAITQGEAWLDEARLTGEPLPQQKGDGDSVHAGTVGQDGSVLFRASAVGSFSVLILFWRCCCCYFPIFNFRFPSNN